MRPRMAMPTDRRSFQRLFASALLSVLLGLPRDCLSPRVMRSSLNISPDKGATCPRLLAWGLGVPGSLDP